MKRKRCVVAALLAAVLLAGCWDRREVNDLALVVASGLDKEGDQYRLTVQIPLPGRLSGIGGGGGGGGGGAARMRPWLLDSAVGSSIRAANEVQQKKLSRQLYFAHRRVFLFGEEAARAGIETQVDVLGRLPQNRLTANILVVRGTARDLLNAEAPVEQTPGEIVRELASASMKEPLTLRDLVHAMLVDGVEPVLPAVELVRTEPGEEGQPLSVIRLSGLAVFRNNRLAGFLDDEESQGVLWALGQVRTPTLQVQIPGKDGSTSVKFQEVQVSVTPVLQQNPIRMRIAVRAKGAIVENTSPVSWAAEGRLPDLAQLLGKEIERLILKGIAALQEHRSDGIGFGAGIHRVAPAHWARLKPRWQEHFVRVKPVVTVEAIVEHSGTFTAPFGHPESELLR